MLKTTSGTGILQSWLTNRQTKKHFWSTSCRWNRIGTNGSKFKPIVLWLHPPIKSQAQYQKRLP